MDHAFLSPSAAERWLVCPPSAHFEASFPETENDFTREGQLAHQIAEYLILYKLGLCSAKEFNALHASWKSDKLYSQLMFDYCLGFAEYVIEEYNAMLAEDDTTEIHTELRIDLSAYVPEGFGTGDVCIVNSIRLKYIDFKYGIGVRVEVSHNLQLKLYALGLIDRFHWIHDFKEVDTHIYQPRINNIGWKDYNLPTLLYWGNGFVKRQALLAFEGSGELNPGDHCQFCAAKANCKANAERQLELAKYQFQDDFLLEPSEISDILTRAPQFINWINAVKDYALKEALKGETFPGYKVVRGRSKRTFTDHKAISEQLVKAGYLLDQITNYELKGITEMEKLLGKKFDQLVGPYLEKQPGAPTLVPLEDKRGEFNQLTEADEQFD